VNKVEDMRYMFYQCYNLKDLNLKNWKTSNVRYISHISITVLV